MIQAEPGDSVPLFLQLGTRDSSLFPRAQVFTEAGATLGAPVVLAAIVGQPGAYIGATTAPAVAGQYPVRFEVYSDGTYTTVSSRELPAEDLIVVVAVAALAALGPAVAAVATDVWKVLRSAPGVAPAGSFGEAVRVVLGTIGKSNVRYDNTVYDGNGFLTTVRLRVFPDSATAGLSTKDAPGLEGALYAILITGTPDGGFPVLPDGVLGLGP